MFTSENNEVKKLELASDYIKKKFGDFSFYNPDKSYKSFSYNYYEKIRNYS